MSPFLSTETDISKRLGEGSHLSWDHPYYDIARHQIVEVAGKNFVSTCVAYLTWISCSVLNPVDTVSSLTLLSR